jgi:hypothetical protein
MIAPQHEPHHKQRQRRQTIEKIHVHLENRERKKYQKSSRQMLDLSSEEIRVDAMQRQGVEALGSRCFSTLRGFPKT